MYDKYFHSKVVDKALGTDEYTDKDWDSFIFRIINLTNKNSYSHASNVEATRRSDNNYQGSKVNT